MPSNPDEVDWVARFSRGVVDFRLPGDGADIPSHIFTARLLAYYRQLRSPAGRGPARRPVATGDLFT